MVNRDDRAARLVQEAREAYGLPDYVPGASDYQPVGLDRRGDLERLVVGALKSAIHDHGPITEQTVSSAAKRVIGVIKAWNRDAR